MLRALRVSAAAAAILGGVIFSGPSSALAADFCDVPVYAGNDTVDPSDPRLNDAIDALAAEDVTTHIVVLDTLDGLSHDAWLRNAVGECASWFDSSTDTGLNPRFLVVVVATNDQLLDSYIGTSLTVQISQREDASVRKNVMVPQLGATQGRDVNPALVEGLRSYYDLLTEPVQVSDQQTAPQQPAAPVRDAPAKESKPFPWWILLLIFAIVVVVLLVWGAVMTIRDWLEKRRLKAEQLEQARAETEAALDLARQESTDLYIGDPDDFETQAASIQLSFSTSHDDETEEMMDELEVLRNLFRSWNDSYLLMTRAIEPTSLTGWRDLGHLAREVKEGAVHIKGRLRELKDSSDAYSQLVMDSSPKAQFAENRLTKLQERIARLKGDGWKTDALEVEVMTVGSMLEVARQLIGEGRYKAGSEKLDMVDPRLQAVVEEADGLPELGKELTGQADKLMHRLHGLRSKQTKVDAMHAQMLEEFGLANLSEVDGFGSEADALLDAVEDALPKVAGFADKEHQDFASARQVLEQSENAMVQAETLYQKIADLRKSLVRARSKSETLLNDVLDKLTAAIKYCKDNEADAGVDELESLRTLRDGKFEELKQARAKAYPDFIGIFAALKQLEASITEYRESAEGDVEAADAERKRLAKAKRDAEDARKELDDYIQNHKGDIDDARIKELRSLGRSGQGTGLSVAEQILLWQQYERVVDGIHNDCKTDVSEAIEARRPKYTSSSWDSNDSYSTGGGRSSFDFGGFSTGGGQSSFGSFGGGSHSTGGGRSGW